MKAELLYGARAASDYRGPAGQIDLATGEDFVLENLQIYYSLFEVPMQVALAVTPVSLHPAIPAHIGITFWRCDSGPLGPFECAWVGLACRTGIKPRHLIQSAFVTNPAVGAWLQRRYGFSCQTAEVHYRENYDRLCGEVVVGGARILEVVTRGMQPVVGAGASVKYSPALNLAQLGSGNVLVQMEASYAFKRVIRGTPQALHYEAATLGDARVAPMFPMSGTHAVADVTLHAPRFTADLTLPAEQGGARKISR